MFAFGNVYVELLVTGKLGDLSQDPPQFFIYSPPDKPKREMPNCTLGPRLAAYNEQYHLENNTFAICGGWVQHDMTINCVILLGVFGSTLCGPGHAWCVFAFDQVIAFLLLFYEHFRINVDGKF